MKLKLKKKVKANGNRKVSKSNKVPVDNGINITIPLQEVILMNKIIAKSEEVIEILERQLKRSKEELQLYKIWAETECEYYKTFLEWCGKKDYNLK